MPTINMSFFLLDFPIFRTFNSTITIHNLIEI